MRACGEHQPTPGAQNTTPRHQPTPGPRTPPPDISQHRGPEHHPQTSANTGAQKTTHRQQPLPGAQKTTTSPHIEASAEASDTRMQTPDNLHTTQTSPPTAKADLRKLHVCGLQDKHTLTPGDRQAAGGRHLKPPAHRLSNVHSDAW